MDTEGNIYRKSFIDGESGRVANGWELTEYPKADVEKADKLVWYKLIMSFEADYSEITSFQLCDLNNDGVDELITQDGMARYSEKTKVYANYGYLHKILEDSGISGYYPKAGVVKMYREKEGGASKASYIELKSGKIIGTVHYAADGSAIYYEGEDEDDRAKMEEDDFNKLLKKYIKKEEMQTINPEDFVENTKENCEKLFLQ